MSSLSDFLDYLNASMTPHHAVRQTCALLEAAGFSQVDEANRWDMAPGSRNYVVRAGKTIAAWIVGQGGLADHGMSIIGAHTDSPCLKPRLTKLSKSRDMSVLNVGIYGSPILQSWLDRDLGMAGAIWVKGQAAPQLFESRETLRTSGLAIHLDKSLRDPGLKPNPQKHMNAILAANGGADDLREVIAAEHGLSASDITGIDVCLYDRTPAAIVGDMISGARLDNLFSCYAAIRALIDAAGDTQGTRAIVLFDAEEIGSRTSLGAQSTFLMQTITRLVTASGGDTQDVFRTLARSRLMSVDMAHGFHPMHPGATDDDVVPELNKGCALKYSHKGHYADAPALSGGIMKRAEEIGVPVQSFSYRNDLGGGTSIGPIVAAEMGMETIDAGAPMLAMHSIRELAGCDDVDHTIALLRDVFFQL